MSVLFPKVNKPREWDYRPIYYDKEKDERAAKLAKLRMERKEKQASQDGRESRGQDEETYVSKLHRGSFREARAQADGLRNKAHRTSRLTFWLVLLMLLAGAFWVCSQLPLWLNR
ncbi:MAG: hypothetical protein NC038_04520 [Paludibacter sp.]|nr:hypothetical protein [Bacteroidales bacterium]MCM1069378.1 hypothetical protein [Prevotella sp.]MCM1353898.1 hypothetical protein [Bacteroides sp.]MCM1442852.1 hypothetical protein [Muribaculum sp.]MCM1481897.1 hypothetical protein [Paludibacter sp.]